MKAPQPKQYITIAGKTVFEHSLSRLLAMQEIVRIVVPVASDDSWCRQLPIASDPRIVLVTGGAQRSESVRKGLDYLASGCRENDWVLVHDVARPCVRQADIRKLLTTLAEDAVGGLLAVPVSDTLKQVEQGSVVGTADRSGLWQALTPQLFRYGLLCRALEHAASVGLTVTDESSAVEALGAAPKVVEGRRDNIKITRPEDAALAAFYLQHIEAEQITTEEMR